MSSLKDAVRLLLEREPHYVHSEQPLPTVPWPATSLGQDNLTGRRVGRLQVIGLSRDNARGRGRWVVRCQCGIYEHRSGRYLRSGQNRDAACIRCDVERKGNR